MHPVVRPIYTVFVISTLASALPPARAQQPHVAQYELKLNELKYDYGVAPPVLRLQPGDVLETNTVDADGHALEDAGIKPPGPNALTGPFYIEGAEPGDTLAIHFLAVEVNAEKGFGSAGPGFGAINSTTYTPMLGGPFPRRPGPMRSTRRRIPLPLKPTIQASPCPYHFIHSWVA